MRFLPGNIAEATSSLLNYCRKENWAGYDPYDALNSRLFNRTIFSRSKLCRIAFTQAMKRSPINLRPLVGIERGHNAKGLSLFASALTKLSGRALEDATVVLQLLLESKAPGLEYSCWGYNFPWQNRVTFVKRGEPNIICTTFAGNAFLDAYEKFGDDRYLQTAANASEFLLKGLNISTHGDEICFSYTPRDREQVHNANLLGAAFLARLHYHTGDSELLKLAVSAAKFTVRRQADNGSWMYGESPSQQWIDNFHTGFNLLALRRLASITHCDEFHKSLQKGFDFYKKSFFDQHGVVKYYHDRIYPIDCHAIAHSIITLVELKDLEKDNLQLALKIFEWAYFNMRCARGYYYFQKGRFGTNRNVYMRWVQAWMLLALASLSEALSPLEAGDIDRKTGINAKNCFVPSASIENSGSPLPNL